VCASSLQAVKQLIAPSILSADFARLAAEVERVAPAADLLHVDVMDGHFVPNLTIGPPVVASLRKHTDLFLHCHLMCSEPGVLLDDFAAAGADGITVHVELGDPRPLLDRIRDLGPRPGLAISPPTPFEAAVPYLDEIGALVLMSVNPGWGGQAFIPEVLDKVRAARQLVDERRLAVDLEIDGGIKIDTAPLATAAGVDSLVSGSAIFHADDPLAAARAIREAGWPTES
jgi:ribulose-phosphate 3-epimerase